MNAHLKPLMLSALKLQLNFNEVKEIHHSYNKEMLSFFTNLKTTALTLLAQSLLINWNVIQLFTATYSLINILKGPLLEAIFYTMSLYVFIKHLIVSICIVFVIH